MRLMAEVGKCRLPNLSRRRIGSAFCKNISICRKRELSRVRIAVFFRLKTVCAGTDLLRFIEVLCGRLAERISDGKF
ncbi:MAG: hypothetical protein DBX55_09770 [Verrucomicrobia bacterium]|nr:MAG: hypothetical protein DBX55_09770 [Verrucomicrobiota bacterium]